jgi:hypothetical protein
VRKFLSDLPDSRRSRSRRNYFPNSAIRLLVLKLLLNFKKIGTEGAAPKGENRIANAPTHVASAKKNRPEAIEGFRPVTKTLHAANRASGPINTQTDRTDKA